MISISNCRKEKMADLSSEKKASSESRIKELEEDEKYGGDIPFRTYWGRKYHGGFSDHLPVCVDFEIGKK